MIINLNGTKILPTITKQRVDKIEQDKYMKIKGRLQYSDNVRRDVFTSLYYSPSSHRWVR